MGVFDLHNNVKVVRALATGTVTVTTDTNGDAIDTAGFESLEFIISSATITDGAYVIKVQESDTTTSGDFTDCAAESVLGSASFAATDDNAVKRIGYIGKKRYARIVIDQTGATTGGVFSAVAVLGTPLHAPVANQ